MPRSISFVRWSGLAAMLGGTLWVIGPLIHASKPRGCIVEGCAFRRMRETGALGGILTPLSVLLLAVGLWGWMSSCGAPGASERWGRWGSLSALSEPRC